MKLLIIGANNIWSIERFYFQYIKEQGIDIHLFDAQNRFIKFYTASIVNKVLYKAGLSLFHKNLNKELIHYVDQLNPDVIWVFKGMDVLPETLQYFKRKNIFLVNYNPDNPFIFTGAGSGNKNVTRSIGLYDLHFTYNYEVRDRVISEYKLPAEILPFGFDVSDELYAACVEETEVLKTCFIGNPDKERAAFINELAKELPIDVYGNEWDKFVNSKNITVHPPKYEEEAWKILRKYRVQLNLMRIHNLDSHNMRTFEVTGIGGIMLAPATKEHHIYFKEGEEAFFFKDVNDCTERIKYILGLSKEESDRIRQNARNAAIMNGYTYKNRSAYVIDTINKYYKK